MDRVLFLNYYYMFKNIINVTFFLFLGGVVFAQKSKDKVLLKIDGEKVYASDFKRLFGKNQGLKAKAEKSDINDDIQLFIDYKLKLMEAEELQMDTVASYLKEVSRYRNQLVLPYLNDDSLIDSLVEEAYERSLKEINASHILVLLDANAKDTVVAYQKINDIRKSIVDGADFSKIAREKSEDPSAKKNAGDLGYFSVFRMVYAFENEAFMTPLGEVSEIFRTQFGYHILKVNDIRESLGEMEVAHIMLRDTTSMGSSTINKVYVELMEGGDFEELAKRYSDDKRSSSNGGRLSRFGMGSLPVPFGEVSFALTEENKYSKPFKTAYGWHIVKYINRYPMGSFEDTKEELLRKTKRDSRSKTLSNPVVTRLKKEYSIVINEDAKKEFEMTNFEVKDSLNTWLIMIENDTLTQKDFSNYIKTKQNKAVLQNFDSYLNQEILEYYKFHLEETDEEFKHLFQEYKNGLLLFDLMKEKIWDAAQNDTIGLQEYFEQNKLNYRKKETFTAVVLRTKIVEDVSILKTFLSEADSIQTIQTKVQGMENVILKSGDFERENGIFPSETDFESGIAKVYEEDGSFVIVKIFSTNSAVLQKFEAVRGRVISDYQNETQESWLSKLRMKHDVKIYRRSVKKITSEMSVYGE
jgi:peptidyl-prolyl cis-trans isomerase SurA